MNSPARTKLFLSHVIDAINRIDAYVGTMDKASFLTTSLVQDAVIRNLEIIGEACNNVRKHDPLFAQAHPEVPWSDAIGNRNALSHGYFSVDCALVWTTVTNDLPAMRRTIETLLAMN